MTALTRAALKTEADTLIADNTAGEVSPEDVRERVKNLADSALFPEDLQGADPKTTPADTDVFAGLDSEDYDLIKLFSWANIKTALASVFARLGVENQTLSGGAAVTWKDLGGGSAITTGTVTPDPGDRPYQLYDNGGAHTLAASTVNGGCIVEIENVSGAGAITLSGFDFVDGDDFDTTVGSVFHCSIIISPSNKSLTIKKLTAA